MSSADDEITKKILNPTYDSEAPTRKIPVRCESSTHETDELCHCVCHGRPSIHHQRPCCKICVDCGFRVRNPPLPVEDDGTE